MEYCENCNLNLKYNALLSSKHTVLFKRAQRSRRSFQYHSHFFIVAIDTETGLRFSQLYIWKIIIRKWIHPILEFEN